MGKMKLFWGSGSPPCMKAIMVMCEFGLWDDCNDTKISFSEKGHKSDEVMKTNPRGQVPTFTDEDKEGVISLNESVAICQYLDEHYSNGKPLIPADKKLRAQVLQRMFEVPNIASNVTQSIVYYMMRTDKDKWDEKVLAEKRASAHTELKRWDGYLDGKAYLVGDEFTMADVFLYNDLAFLVRQGLPVQELYPNLFKYHSAMQERPSAVKSYPPHWKESSSPNMLADFKPE